MTMDVKTGLLGFGNQLKSNFLLTSLDLSNPDKIATKTDASIQMDVAFPDECTMVLSELKDDGTRYVLLLTPQVIDPSGEPMGARGPDAK